MRDYDEINFVKSQNSIDIAGIDIEILKEALRDLEINVTPDLEEKLKKCDKIQETRRVLKIFKYKMETSRQFCSCDVCLGDINQGYLNAF